MTDQNDRIAALPRVRFANLPEPAKTPVDWPELEGQVIIAFTSRVGSTFLSAEIERTRDVRNVGEAFNEAPLRSFQQKLGLQSLDAALAERIRSTATAGWFVGKAGVPGLSVAERFGQIDKYLDRTSFIFLFRRDVAAQAVSIVTAKMSGQYHSSQQSDQTLRRSQYDKAMLVSKLKNIVRGCEALSGYLKSAARPTSVLFYEDFRSGDMSKPFAMLDRAGVPKREKEIPAEVLGVKPVTRSVSAEWAARLRDAREAQPLLDKHARIIDEAVARYGS